MAKSCPEVLRQRHIRDKAAARTAKAAFKSYVAKQTKSIRAKVARAHKSRKALLAANLDPGSDLSESDGEAAQVAAPVEEQPEDSDSSGGSDSEDTPQAEPEQKVKSEKEATGAVRGRPRKDAVPAPKAPSTRRAPNAEGVLYPGFPKGNPKRCPACEQLLGGRASATSKHIEECAWRVRKVPLPRGKVEPKPAV